MFEGRNRKNTKFLTFWAVVRCRTPPESPPNLELPFGTFWDVDFLFFQVAPLDYVREISYHFWSLWALSGPSGHTLLQLDSEDPDRAQMVAADASSRLCISLVETTILWFSDFQFDKNNSGDKTDVTEAPKQWAEDNKKPLRKGK